MKFLSHFFRGKAGRNNLVILLVGVIAIAGLFGVMGDKSVVNGQFPENCYNPLPGFQPPYPPGMCCSNNGQCSTGYCSPTPGVGCTTPPVCSPACSGGQICSNGTCVNPPNPYLGCDGGGTVGSSCGATGDCGSGLVCSPNSGTCSDTQGGGSGQCCTFFVPNPPQSISGAYTTATNVRLTIPAAPFNGTGTYHHAQVLSASQQVLAEDLMFPQTSGAQTKDFTIGVSQTVTIRVRNYDPCQQIYGGWVYTTTITPPPQAGVCTGPNPVVANSVACSGDDTPPTDTARVLVSACTPKGGGNPWCEFKCNSGYHFVAGNAGGVQVGEEEIGGAGQNNPSGSGYCEQDVTTPPPSNNNICGFAWGATNQAPNFGVGWISFNVRDCSNDTTAPYHSHGQNGCPAAGTVIPTYGVGYNPDGTLTGTAFSNNIGWIIFGGLNTASMPTSAGNSQINATLSGDPNTSATLSGWAQAFHGTEFDDGWDGWISLKGTATNGGSYGVTVSNRQFSGYSWGDDVVGWTNWNPGAGNGVRFCDAQTLTATLTASSPIVVGNSSQLSASTGGTYNGTKLYSYQCSSTGAWSTPTQDQTSFTCGPYTSVGAQAVSVKVTGTGVPTAQAYATVQVTSGPTPPNSTLSVTCNANGPAYVNQPFGWTVQVSGGTPPYNYIWHFDNPIPTPTVTGGNTADPTTSYRTIGTKEASVDVTDSGAVVATGTCSTRMLVKSEPSFIER